LLQPKTCPGKFWQRFVLSDTEFREEQVLKPLHPPDRLETATLPVTQRRSWRTATLLWAERSRYSSCQTSELYYIWYMKHIYVYIYIYTYIYIYYIYYIYIYIFINRQAYSPKRVISKSQHFLLLQPKTCPGKFWQRFVLSDTEFREEQVLKPLHPPDRLETATLPVTQRRSWRTATLLWAERSRYSSCQTSELY
jgi:hypothetical protein